MKGLMFGPSMKPTMGRVNFVYGEKYEFLCVGDVVCFSRKGKLPRVIHRIVDIDSHGMVYIKGDNAPEVDCVPLSSVHFKITKFKKLL